MPFKHVWKFSQPDGSTWEEVWYNASNGTLASQSPEDPATVNARLILLNANNKWVSSTISDLGNPRAVLPQVINKQGVNAPMTQQGAPAVTGGANVVKVVGVAGGQKHWWLRGGDNIDLAKSLLTSVDNPSPTFLLMLKNFLKAAAAVQFGLLLGTKVVPGNATTGYFYLKNAVPSTQAGSTDLTMTVAPTNWQVNQRVRIGLTDPKTEPGLKGDWTITAVTGAVITIAYRCPADTAIATAKGRIRLLPAPTVSVINPDASGWIYNKTHTTRSPLPNSRGARRPVRLRTLA